MATTKALFFWTAFAAVYLSGEAESRAVNISNTWILPQEGFPVFYRYFRDRISWYEADAVCQFHHANLVTVDTTSQYDAARAYLKELDIMSNVWIGLIKSNEEGDFSWTDYKPLSGEGYWAAAPGDGRAPLCAALDPAHDFRWSALSCGGPQVASFICELPVPTWALSESGGCLVRSIPSLTVQYLPELAAVRLASDCGLDGTKSVTCKANEEHKDILRELSCFMSEDDFADNTVTTVVDGDASSGSTSRHSSWSFTPTTSSMGDFSSSTRLRRETPDSSTPLSIESTTAIVGSRNTSNQTSPSTSKQPTTMSPSTTPVLVQEVTVHKITETHVSESPAKATFTESPKKINLIKERKHQKEHVDIFTQPTDHFIPPLVMAKSKVSTDMTLVSAESKHLQNKASHKIQPHIGTTVLPIVHLKPTLIKGDVVSPVKIEPLTTTTTIQPETHEIDVTSIKPEPTTVQPIIIAQTTILPSDDYQNVKYKKPTKNKKYDKKKEEKKKYKDSITEIPELITESHKVVQVTINSIDQGMTTIDITTRRTEAIEKYTTTAPSTILKTEIISTLNPVIDPNIMKLNKKGNINKDSENIDLKSNATISSVESKNESTTIQSDASSKIEAIESVDHSPEPLPRPNRSRLLTHQPQHRSLYPYFFNRVLG